MSNITMTISSEKIVEFRDMLKKFNKKAEKANASGISVESMNKTVKTINNQHFEVFEVVMSKPRFAIGNYQIDAVMHHDEGGADVVFTFNDYKHGYNTKVDYRRCDHCNVKHARKTVVAISENGNQIQVGKSCIKDYMGISLSTFNWFNEMVCTFSNSEYWDIEEDEKGVSKGKLVYDVDQILAYAYDVCSVGGYKKVDDLNGIPTISEINYRLGKCIQPTDKGYLWAEEAKAIINNMLATNEYEQNIQNIIKAGYVSGKMMALLASSYVMVKRVMDDMKQRSQSTSQYVGTIKERITFDGVIKSAYAGYGFYGHYVMYIIEDDNGNQFKWICTSEKNMNLVEGGEYKITGTIKEHEEYKGVKQTLLNRCKVIDK